MPVDALPENRLGGRRNSTFRRALGEQGAADLVSVLESASRIVETDESLELDSVQDFKAANRALDKAWGAVSSALSGDQKKSEAVSSSTDLVDLLTKIREEDTAIHIAENARQVGAFQAIRPALARLQNVSSVSELIELVPEAICSLGFDRSILSRIEDSKWVPQSLLISGDQEWSSEVLELGRQFPPPIVPSLYEAEIVRRRVGILVADAQDHLDKTHTAVVSSSQSRSYVAAPIMPGSSVIGFLHADRYFQRGEVDEFDRDILVNFAEGVSYAVHLAVLAERFRNLKSEVFQLTEGLSTSVDGLMTLPTSMMAVQGGPSLSGQRPLELPQSPPDYAAYVLAPESPLTRREFEVLKLMATGASNDRIANQLVIAVGTVKTHVKSILRKLQANNRAEAVARWLNFERKVENVRHTR
ncbi:MAG: modulated transcriptional regulator, LuxR family [Marmoricola sp.]|nr:modulated transcriptional regulator, LuxR family [Marmoricola sp.]